MEVLLGAQLSQISGGFSEEMTLSVQGGVLGSTEGAVIGGLLSAPLWSTAASYGGSSLAIACLALGIGAGSLLGGVLGLCAGYSIYYCYYC